MARHFDNLVQVYQWMCEAYADRDALGTKRDDGWHWINRRQLLAMIDGYRGGLAALGVGPGDRVAIVSNNRVEWAAACYATYGLGATFVPMYEAQLPKEWGFILGDCEAKVVIGATPAICDQLRELKKSLPTLQHVVGLDLPETDPTSFEAMVRQGEAHPIAPVQPDGETVAGFIYTSGTTGNPKGVVLSHGNLASNLEAVLEAFPIMPEDRFLSFLPWAHSYGQTGELHYGLLSGSALAINDRIENLLANMAEVKPTLLVAVPRIFNRLYESVLEQVAARPAFVQKMFWDGIRSATRKGHGEQVGPWRKMELRLDDRLIFSKVREKMGGRLRMVLSASAALEREVAEFVDAIGLTIYEAYGLSETSPAVSINRPGERKMGSVGKPLPGVRVVIDTSVTRDPKEGEIVVYGPNVMKGYHNRPEETAAVLMPDGGLRTGDLGFVDDEGYLFISGRIKEQYKLQNGKYVMPAPLEEKLKLSPYIASVMIYGDNKPFNVALVVPDMAMVRKWAERAGVEIGDIATCPELLELISHEIEMHGGEFKKFELPQKILLVEEDFTTENDMLTPTLKTKRRNVVDRYRERLEALYRESEAAVVSRMRAAP